MSRPKDTPPSDDEEKEPIPIEPKGADLTEKRKRQKDSRESAERTWEDIKRSLQPRKDDGTHSS